MDYVFGWLIYARKDVQYDRFTIFDRYSYDLIADPERTRLSLPLWIRKTFVRFMPHPKISFFLKASPEIVYKRKPELQLEEIKRQVSEYTKIASWDKRVFVINANASVDKIVNEAKKVIINKYWERL
jgi:thymidylate kinase